MAQMYNTALLVASRHINLYDGGKIKWKRGEVLFVDLIGVIGLIWDVFIAVCILCTEMRCFLQADQLI